MLNELLRKVHYTELRVSGPGDEPDSEWNTYCREVGRLLAEGNEGRFVLIKGEQVLGIWDTRREAVAEGCRRFPLEPILVHQVQTWEPILVQRIRYN